MIIGSNDIKASCRAMLISAKQSESGSGGGSGEVPIPNVPDPPSWEYPEEFWIAKPASATAHHITGILCIKKSSSNRTVELSLCASSGSSSMGFMNWGDGIYEGIEKTSTSLDGKSWGGISHTYYSGTGHQIYIYGEAYEQWTFEISLYNFGDYSDDNPVFFAGIYNTTSNLTDRPSLQWVSIGDNVSMHANSSGQITNANIDQYRLFGRETLLEYVEIGAGCQILTRNFEPVSGVTSQIKEVVLKGDIDLKTYTFYNCTNLYKITGAEYIKTINSYSMNNCKSLVKLVCPNARLSTSTIPTGLDSIQLFYVGTYYNTGRSFCLFKQ